MDFILETPWEEQNYVERNWCDLTQSYIDEVVFSRLGPPGLRRDTELLTDSDRWISSQALRIFVDALSFLFLPPSIWAHLAAVNTACSATFRRASPTLPCSCGIYRSTSSINSHFLTTQRFRELCLREGQPDFSIPWGDSIALSCDKGPRWLRMSYRTIVFYDDGDQQIHYGPSRAACIYREDQDARNSEYNRERMLSASAFRWIYSAEDSAYSPSLEPGGPYVGPNFPSRNMLDHLTVRGDVPMSYIMPRITPPNLMHGWPRGRHRSIAELQGLG